MVTVSQIGSGKTVLVQEFLRLHRRLTRDKTDDPLILYCYRAKPPQPLPGVHVWVRQGLPELKEILSIDRRKHKNVVLVLEDLMSDISRLSGQQAYDYTNLIIEISRQQNISIIATFQNCFPKGDIPRLFLRNTTGVFLFAFPTDGSSVSR